MIFCKMMMNGITDETIVQVCGAVQNSDFQTTYIEMIIKIHIS